MISNEFLINEKAAFHSILKALESEDYQGATALLNSEIRRIDGYIEFQKVIKDFEYFKENYVAILDLKDKIVEPLYLPENTEKVAENEENKGLEIRLPKSFDFSGVVYDPEDEIDKIEERIHSLLFTPIDKFMIRELEYLGQRYSEALLSIDRSLDIFELDQANGNLIIRHSPIK